MIHPVETTEVTATGTATTGNGKLMGGILTAGSGAAATVTLYDNTAASGTVLRAVNAPAGESKSLDLAAGRHPLRRGAPRGPHRGRREALPRFLGARSWRTEGPRRSHWPPQRPGRRTARARPSTSGGSPTLDFDIEAGPADDALGYIHTEPAQITGTGKTLVKLTNLGKWFRLSWDIGGSSPSFTFEAKLAVKT